MSGYMNQRQLLTLLRAVNRARKGQGLASVERTCFRFKRRINRVFPTTISVTSLAEAPEGGPDGISGGWESTKIG